MKKLHETIILLVLLISASCNKGSEDTAATDTYIPNLSAIQWINVADNNDNIFFFSTPPAGSASGTFNGNRNISGGASESFTGSFTNSSIQLVFTAGTNNNRVFTGKIDGAGTPVTFTISTPASGANPALTLKYRK